MGLKKIFFGLILVFFGYQTISSGSLISFFSFFFPSFGLLYYFGWILLAFGAILLLQNFKPMFLRRKKY